ncbi:uncharacterized protein LOC132205660 [Neocloeon triangulifer]|uniref:uncharacterized protein LOC132205660 n=1 Tax=Neocloeon triangulifer TaxID=2078957 RepID=UPI00286F1AC5|nr:uncharacterized protein LOC132205660 [Neocloeon triangulifer]
MWRSQSVHSCLLVFLVLIDVIAGRPVDQINAISSFDVATQNGSNSLNGLQKLIYNYLEPKPIVDTIKEQEKYGNDGDVLGGVGRAIVGGTESLSVFTANTISLPGSVFRRLISRLTDNLGRMGAQIVGL